MKMEEFDKSSLYYVDSTPEGTRYSLYDTASWKNGLAFKNIDFSETGLPVIKIAELNNGISSSTAYTDKTYSQDVFLTKGDYVFSWSGNPETSIDIYKYNLPDGWLNQHIFKITPKTEIIDKGFFFYLMKFLKPYFKKIATNKQTTGLGHVTISDLQRMSVTLPSLPTQQKIAAILSFLDDKIELNNKINTNLEQQAQALFKNWFVDNDSNLTEIEIGKLDILITDYVANGSFKDLADNVKYLTEETNNVLIRLTDYNNNFASDMVYISDKSYDFLEKSKLYGDEIIISNVGANVGTVFRCPRLSKRMSLAPNSIMIRANNYEHYLYLFFTSAYGQGLLKSIVTGSAQPKFNKTNFRSLKIKIPNEEQLSMFNNIYDSIHEKIINNQKENMNLASIRDTLLPKLMNGEIEVD